jgi:hypothetical protein
MGARQRGWLAGAALAVLAAGLLACGSQGGSAPPLTETARAARPSVQAAAQASATVTPGRGAPRTVALPTIDARTVSAGRTAAALRTATPNPLLVRPTNWPAAWPWPPRKP